MSIIGRPSGFFLPASLAYATWNPSDKSSQITLSNGDLTAAFSGASNGLVRSALSKAAGKWYWEITINSGTEFTGVANATASTGEYPGQSANSLGYSNALGKIYKGATAIVTGLAAATAGDVIGVAVDLSVPSVSWYKNGSLLTTVSTTNVPTGALFAAVGTTGGGTFNITANFGASALGSVPSGYNSGLYQ